jgi:hypothetical protein
MKLNEIEQSICKHIAEQRYLNARKKGIVDRKLGGQTTEITDLDGFGAEMAFCKIANCYPDLKIGLDNDYDCLYNGLKIDVKQTKYKKGRLLATLKKTNSDVDIYVLMIGEFPNYEFIGWARKDDLIKPENIKDLGRGNGYVLEQSQLKSKEELLNGNE